MNEHVRRFEEMFGVRGQLVPRWLADMEFCHILVDDDSVHFCGRPVEEGDLPPPCGYDYDGEAICPSCGLPTCPRCAQLSALEDQIEGDSDD